MRFSVFTDMLGCEDFEKSLQAAVELGFSIVDLRAKLNGDSIDTISLEKAKEIKKHIDDYGLQVNSVSSWAVNSCTFSGPPKYDSHDPAHHQKMTVVLERLFDLADIFEVQHVRVYSLHRPEGFDQWPEAKKEAEYAYNATIMRGHAEHAKSRGKILLVENEPPTLTKGPRELGMLVTYANHPNLKINWDIINSWWAGEYPSLESYEYVKGALLQTHLKGAYRKPNSINLNNPHGDFKGFAIAGEDDYEHSGILQSIAKHDPQAVMTIDTHYPSLEDKDKVGEAEVVRRSKVYFESTLVEVKSNE